ncbi:MAG: WecB/TagA/CpsF family glycosyltransferase [Clostridiales bacterium]
MQSKVTEKQSFGEKETVQEVTQACEETGIIGEETLEEAAEQVAKAAGEAAGADERTNKVAAREIAGEPASEEGAEREAFDKDAVSKETNEEKAAKSVAADDAESLALEAMPKQGCEIPGTIQEALSGANGQTIWIVRGAEKADAKNMADILGAIPKVDILGFPVANVDMEESVAAVAAVIAGRGPGETGVARPEFEMESESESRSGDEPGSSRRSMRIVTANAEILYHAYADPKLGELLHSADLIVPDGIGVVKAAERLGRPVKGRVAGVDLLWQLAAWAADKGRSIYLLGAARESVEGAAAALQVKYPALQITGWHDGYFDDIEKERILQEIEEKRPDFLFIAMGFPAQDRFFVENRERLPVGIMMGVGGAFDALSGRVQRAPGWIQKMNLEWAYRFAQNPKRLGRIWALPRFMMAVGRQKGREKE